MAKPEVKLPVRIWVWAGELLLHVNGHGNGRNGQRITMPTRPHQAHSWTRKIELDQLLVRGQGSHPEIFQSFPYGIIL